MLNLISTLPLILFALQGQSSTCAVTGEPVSANVAPYEWRGAKFEFCCPNCQSSFKSDPAKFISIRAEKGQSAGRYLFDPVSTVRIEPGESTSETVFKGIRFVFSSEENKSKFLSDPTRFATYPNREALYCPVGKEPVKDYSSASDYSDHEGIRFFMCCAGCKEAFEKEPENYTAAAASHVRASHIEKAQEAKNPFVKRVGNYEIELRVPSGGIPAERAIDVEFRLSDTRAKDEIEDGFKGVGGATATARVTMPSMPGMPAATPKIHREGVPGDYGVELNFPHAGVYDLDLSISIPSGEKVGVRFSLDVKDAAPNTPTIKPFKLNVLSSPKQAGTSQQLKMQIVDTQTGKVQTAFDTAHERKFHLLIVSKDLNWFLHEHPVMSANGTWSLPVKLPAGTQYWVYADVAPSGKGSQVLASQIRVSGARPKWNTALKLTTSSNLAGVKGILGSLEPLSAGDSLTMQLKLFSTQKGKPLPKITPWLGASGHMMIFHQDGQTVVHSHPVEGPEAADLLKKGIIRFSARYPRPGTYKVYAQAKIGGSVRTFNFAVKVTQ